MKLLYFANIRLPTEKAHGIQIMQTCQAFARAGTEVSLAVPTRRNPAYVGVDPHAYYGVKRLFEIHALPAYDPAWLMRFPQGTYITFQRIIYGRAVRRFLKAQIISENDIFYTRDESVLPLLLTHSGRVAWEAHTLPRHAKRYARYWRTCMRIVSISQGLKKDLMALGIPDGKIVVAPDGTDIRAFEIQESKTSLRERLGLPQDKYIVMYTGHLYEWKGAQTLADAARAFPDGMLAVFVGGTEHDLRRFQKKNELNRHMVCTGYKQPAEIPYYLNAADALVLPNSGSDTVSRRYTSPMKLFEYMASGRPIIASDLPSLREVLNERNACFFTAGDAAHLAERIVYVRAHPEEATARAAKAREEARAFTWERRAATILNALLNEYASPGKAFGV